MSAAPQPLPLPNSAPVPLPPAQAGGGRKLWVFGSLLVLGAAGLAWGLRNVADGTPEPGLPAVRTAKAIVAPLVTSIRVAGQTSAREFMNVTAPKRSGEGAAQMELLTLPPMGTIVKPGDVIVRVDSQALQDHIDDVQATVIQAEADVAKRQAEQAVEWGSLEQTLKVAKAELDKARLEAAAAEIRTSIDRELLQLAVDEADAKYKQLSADLATTREKHATELRILDLTVARHRRHVRRHQDELTRFTIKASMGGLAVPQTTWRGENVGTIMQGDQVNPGQQVMKVVKPDTMQVEGTINQAESSLFRLGQPAEIQFDAFPDLKVKGHISNIGALAQGGWRWNPYIRSVPVRIAIDQQDKRIIPDLSASAIVRIAESGPVLQVPRAAVQDENGQPVVYVKNGLRWDKRAVELGPKNDLNVAVLKGVNQGEEVALGRP